MIVRGLLQGNMAVVQGGSSGIGQAIAMRVGQGVKVAINHVGPLQGALATREAIDAGAELRCGSQRVQRTKPGDRRRGRCLR